MTPLDPFTDHSTLYLETVRRNGKDRQTPARLVQEWERLYVRMFSNSGKVKRHLNNARLLVAFCGREGHLLGSWIPAVGGEVCDDPEVEVTVDQLFNEKASLRGNLPARLLKRRGNKQFLN